MINDLKSVYRQSNQFIEEVFTPEFTLQELKIIEYIMSQKVNLAQKVMSLSVRDLAKIIRAHPNDIYKRVNIISNELINKKMNYKCTDKNRKVDFSHQTFFISAVYSRGNLNIQVNPKILSYLENVLDNYTEFNLNYILNINSIYGIKLYKLLKQYENISKQYRDFTINRFREQLSIADEKYITYGNLKMRVIDVAVTQINENTDILIKYQEFKTGHKVDKLRFFISAKKSQLEQAKNVFENFMDSLPVEAYHFKNTWDKYAEDRVKRLELFQECFNRFIELSCKNYIALSTNLLEVIQENELTNNKKLIVREIYMRYVLPKFNKPSS